MDVQALLAKVDPEHIKNSVSTSFRESLLAMDGNAKAELRRWVGDVRAIRADDKLDEAAKKEAYGKILTSDVAMDVLKSLASQFSSKMPAGSDSKMNMGLSYLGKFGSKLTNEFDGVARQLIEKALPAILSGTRFDFFLEMVEEEIGKPNRTFDPTHVKH
nr:hypothetical protein [uncultured organism]